MSNMTIIERAEKMTDLLFAGHGEHEEARTHDEKTGRPLLVSDYIAAQLSEAVAEERAEAARIGAEHLRDATAKDSQVGIFPASDESIELLTALVYDLRARATEEQS